ncbi:MAG TPA: glucosidase, partial [Gemmataceae bacterium]
MTTREHERLREIHDDHSGWRRWGPYVSERAWATIREDYSADGNAWEYLPHDFARSKAYRWGEDGIAAICDRYQLLCFAPVFWNERDPILKERLFGLTAHEGNHGEDVKEYYFHVENTPTHSYMKYVYKYPQAAFPYGDLVQTNRRRTRGDLEYELIDTGIFDKDRYFDVIVEYAKSTPDDILIQISICNRGDEAAALHVLPTLWFRNTWSEPSDAPKPLLKELTGQNACRILTAVHSDLGDRFLYCEGDAPLLFTENETNRERIFGTPNPSPYVKDGIHNYVVFGREDMVNPQQVGTKAAAHYRMKVEAGGTFHIRLRLSDRAPASMSDPFGTPFAETIQLRRHEADEFYHDLEPPGIGEDRRRVMRQALAGMLWTKQYFYFDLDKWLAEHGVDPRQPGAAKVRNTEWFHMVNDHIISMPDKWEYPWYAAWDLAFHTIALSTVDVDLAQQQLDLMLNHFFL